MNLREGDPKIDDPIRISVDEWRAAVTAATEPVDDPNALTPGEIAEVLGLSRTQTYQRIRALLEAGRAIKTKKRKRDRSGRVQAIVAYRLVKKDNQ